MAGKLSSNGSNGVDAMRDGPKPGGEPLWSASLRPREFRLDANQAETCKNRRLPGTSQTVRSSTAGCKRIGASGKCPALGHSREPPVATLFGRIGLEAKFVRSPGTCQSGSPPDVGPSRIALTCHTVRSLRGRGRLRLGLQPFYCAEGLAFG